MSQEIFLQNFKDVVKMKRLFLILGIFLAINFEISAFTQKEKIQQTLSKLGVKQELINETISLSYEIRDTRYFEDDEKRKQINFFVPESRIGAYFEVNNDVISNNKTVDNKV